MKFPIFASFIIFMLLVRRAIRRGRRKQASTSQNFWDRENQANSVRRKSLDNLDYVHIPFDRLPTQLMTEDAAVAEALRQLQDLSTQKIVNLTGYTNTDLKLKYGAANITVLSEYDQNYTILARTLQSWADALWDAGHEKEAADIMEFAIETHTDISRTYYKLAKYYSARGKISRIQELISLAGELQSANKKVIIRTLREDYKDLLPE